ncbi:MAG: hypothetical protein GXX85_09800 [Ignavibacteria bacterium]|nr:hypothetical protein [Ignavibacteria bacterium]
MKLEKIKTVVQLAIVVLILNTVYAGSKYVSNTGSDLTGVGSIENPWRTITFALCGGDYGCQCSAENSNIISAGDTLFIRKGVYHEHSITIKNSGTELQNIVIMGYPNEEVIIDGDSADVIFDLGRFGHGNSYIKFYGLQFTNADGSCIVIGENFTTSDIIIDSCLFTNYHQEDNTGAVHLKNGYKNVKINNCRIYGNGNSNQNYTGVIMFSSDGSVEVSNCDISNVGTGIFYKHRSNGTKQIKILNNFIHNNLTRGIWLSSDRALIKNNLVVNNNKGELSSGSGITIWEDAGGTGGGYSRLEHNTIFGSRWAVGISYGGQLSITGDKGAMHDTLYNCIIDSDSSTDVPLSIWSYVQDTNAYHGTVSDYNCYYSRKSNAINEFYNRNYSLAKWKLKYNERDVHSIQEKPMFKNISGTLSIIEDFEIAGGDLINNANDGTDIGCNIYQVGTKWDKLTDVKITESNNLKMYSLSQNYPNPFNPSTTIKFRTPLNSPLYQRGETGAMLSG